MKNILMVFIAVVLISKSAYGQNTAYFTFDINGYNIDKIIKTSDNNYFGVLYFNKGNIFVKFDALFNVVWAKHLSNMTSIKSLDLAESNNGNFFALCANSDSSFVFKLDKNGNLLHSKYFTSSSVNNFTPTNLTHSISGDGVLISGGYCNIPNYLIRLDDNFNVLWKHKYRDGTGSCNNTRSSDIITENNHYICAFNPIIGGINLGSIDDNGNVINCLNYNLTLQTAGFPVDLIKLKNGGYVAAWESIATSNGKEFIYFDSATNYARSKKYNLGPWSYLDNMLEYTNDKIIIGGTIQVGTNQPSIYIAANEKGKILWSKTSTSSQNPNSVGQLHCFVHGLDNTVFAFGGASFDGAYGAKLDYNGLGYCNATNQTASIASADSVTGTSRTITKLALTELVDGSINAIFTDTNFTRTVRCGTLTNTPLSSSVIEWKNLSIYPNPCSNHLILDFPYTANWHVEVYSILGHKIINQSSFKSAQLNLDVANLTPGQYFILLKDGKNQNTYSFLKE